MQYDKTWSIFDEALKNRDHFRKMIVPQLHLRPEVPAPIVESFRVITKLIEHSYYEYKFLSTAGLECMLTLEMALRLRYKELTQKEWAKNLQDLLKWFDKADYIEVYNDEYLNGLRTIRNNMAHPSPNNSMGLIGSHLIEDIADLINGLYEDNVLRKSRKQLTHQLTDAIVRFNNRMVFTLRGQRYSIYSAWLAFVGNKNNSLAIHLYFKPAFAIEDKDFTVNGWGPAVILYFNASSYTIGPDLLSLTDGAGDTLLIKGMTDISELTQFEQWTKKYEKYQQPNTGNIFTEKGITDTFSIHLRDFHKL